MMCTSQVTFIVVNASYPQIIKVPQGIAAQPVVIHIELVGLVSVLPFGSSHFYIQ
jgi:hypothetical protein